MGHLWHELWHDSGGNFAGLWEAIESLLPSASVLTGQVLKRDTSVVDTSHAAAEKNIYALVCICILMESNH